MREPFRSPTIRPAAGKTRAVVLVLHGGRATSVAPSRPWHLSSLRMVPFARDLHRHLADQQAAVWSVRYRVRGWNGADASPVADARAALDLVRDRHGDVPVVLLGHSMGGRAALRLADDPSVHGVVALAPWLPPGEPVSVDGRVIHVAHGSEDRWTDPRASRAWAQRARTEAADVMFTSVDGSGHFMLSNLPTWHRLTRAGAVEGLSAVRHGASGREVSR